MTPPARRRSAPSRLACNALAAIGFASALAGSGCGNKPAGASSSTAETTETPSADVTASSSAALGIVPARLNDEPKGAGVAKVAPASAKDSGCSAATFELASYLLRGELTVAGRPTPKGGEFAASYLIQLQGKAQIGFAGYDGSAKRISRDRGIGSAHEHPPHLFATAGLWTVVWFDDAGLAYAHPTWDTTEKPPIEHMSTLKNVKPADVALAATPEGPLVVASPFGTQGDQVSLFLFAPIAEGQKKRAIGVTRNAKKPSSPAVLGDKTGYTLTWLEEDGQIVASRFDQEGKELGPGTVAVGGPGKRSQLALTELDSGALLTWVDGDRVLGRMLDDTAKPSGDSWVIGKGKFPTATASGPSAIVTFVGEADGAADQLVAVRVGPTGVSEGALRVSEGKTAVLDQPAIAVGGPKVAFVWTEVMGPAISSKRAWIRTIDASCLK